ncbi:pK205R [African swine fever virus]|uniref:PK205R n=1 Tax=African swine fever virus TaxID=10497 RepID=A0A856Z1L6_ASF|nr:pK205R [African swine fever virus]QGM12903.2 pK205R [African swine fever virus]
MVEPREQFFQDLLSAVDQQMNTVKNDIKDIMKEKTSFMVSFENFIERYDTMEKNIQDLQNKYEEMAANLMTVMTDTKIQLGAIIAQLEILMINGTPLPAKKTTIKEAMPLPSSNTNNEQTSPPAPGKTSETPKKNPTNAMFFTRSEWASSVTFREKFLTPEIQAILDEQFANKTGIERLHAEGLYMWRSQFSDEQKKMVKEMMKK